VPGRPADDQPSGGPVPAAVSVPVADRHACCARRHLPGTAGTDAAAGADRVDPRSVGARVRAAPRRALSGRGAQGPGGRRLAGRPRHRILRRRSRVRGARHHVLRRRVPGRPVLPPRGADRPAAAGGTALSRCRQAVLAGHRRIAGPGAGNRGSYPRPHRPDLHVSRDYRPAARADPVPRVLLPVVRGGLAQRAGQAPDLPGAAGTRVRVSSGRCSGSIRCRRHTRISCRCGSPEPRWSATRYSASP
jgi:hypothetical protein